MHNERGVEISFIPARLFARLALNYSDARKLKSESTNNAICFLAYLKAKIEMETSGFPSLRQKNYIDRLEEAIYSAAEHGDFTNVRQLILEVSEEDLRQYKLENAITLTHLKNLADSLLDD